MPDFISYSSKYALIQPYRFNPFGVRFGVRLPLKMYAVRSAQKAAQLHLRQHNLVLAIVVKSTTSKEKLHGNTVNQINRALYFS